MHLATRLDNYPLGTSAIASFTRVLCARGETFPTQQPAQQGTNARAYAD
jgi:hypothetical protein